MDPLSANIAANVRRLREQRGLSQQQVATIAQIPRPTWANLESGQANPTISVLTKVASALSVSVEDLLQPAVGPARLVRAETLPSRKRGRVSVRTLLPVPLPGLDWERLVLPPKTQLAVTAHARGSHKYTLCELGELEVTVGEAVYECLAGDVLVFRGDQPHTFRNSARSATTAHCLLTFAGASSA